MNIRQNSRRFDMISVIVPVYNAERYISLCIEKILKQTYNDFELILVDDGCTDKSGQICDIYAQKDKRIKVVHKKNGGVSSARNRGIQEATSKFISFIDADDEVNENYLSHLMAENKADLVVSGLTYVQTTKNISNIPTSFYSIDINEIGKIIPELEYKLLLNGPCQKRFKKEILNLNGICFNTDISHGEDTLFVLQYMQYVSSINVCQYSDYLYNQSIQGSLTKSHAKYIEAYCFAEEMYKLRLQMYERFKIENEEYRSYLQALYQEYLFVSVYALYYHKVKKSERLEFLKKVYASSEKLIYKANTKKKNIVSTFLCKLGNPKLSDFLYRQVLWGEKGFFLK